MTGAAASQVPSRRRVLGAKAATFLQQQGALVALIAVCIFGAMRYYAFPTPENLLNVLRPNSMLGLVALGMTFVILTGGIDLSVGSVLGLTGCVTAQLLTGGMPIPLAILLGLGVGVALVVTLTALSDGLDRAQEEVLEPLTGVGTDMSVTRPIDLGQGDLPE